MSTRPLPIYSTDQDFYDALSRRDERAYQYLYAESFPSFRHWVLSNSGTEMDAEDAFQKGLLNFLLNIETGKYQLQEGTRITTVVFEYCKYVWLTELKSARFRTRAAMPDVIETPDTTDVVKDLERMEVVNAVRQSLQQLKGECRKLLEWFYVEEVSLREIAERLNMKETSVKSKRYDCAEKLKSFYQKTANQQGL
ncbi:sigma-70 family RNA polymerase sigma factor [Spirosoma sp. HMF4905]|uniref:Sigma-70 family RNA polymerase sigma factor n=1 Tax=Spirosoma arboris TaxID=2682092 RepID=A0A7K1S4I3_9BACT|nr:sigma-70 family RNA polymerase sigma factor [Spirosoma arboris]MVM28710.1 sigma-70 family RNA polymerase sigma factor [Spirosoma arboris]